MRLLFCVLTFFIGVNQGLWAQGNQDDARFTAAIIAGINISQIDGDEDGSYSKIGFNGGARGGVRFGDKMELCTEILFSQKGSYVARIDKLYHLDYVEVPVLFYYKDWEAVDKQNRKFMRVMVGAGLSYSRLINATVRQFGVDLRDQPDWEDPFLDNDFMVMLDASVFFTRNIALNVRWARSFISIVDQPLRQQITYAINRSINIRLMYKF